MTIFTLFVQVGRVAQVSYGSSTGKLVTIVDIIDQNRVLVNGPDSTLREENLKNLNLLPILLTGVTSDSSKDEWKKAWETQKVEEHFAKSKLAQKQKMKALRSGLNDFQRHQVAALKKKRNAIINAKFTELKQKHSSEQQKKQEERNAVLAKIEKSRKAKLTHSFKKLARKLTKKGKLAHAEANKKKSEAFLQAHPEKKDAKKKTSAPKKRTPNTQRKKKDEPARLKRKAEGEKKLAQKKAQKK